MATKLVSNLLGATHHALVKDLLCECEEVIFASPYLYENFDAWLDSVDLGSVRKLTLLTTLAPKGDDQLRKPSSLLSLIRGIKVRWTNLKVVIQIDNKLHGKIYLFKRNGVLTDGIVTSANLTFSGLSAKHEWGLHVTDSELLAKIHADICSVVEYPFVSEELLERMEMFVDQYLRDHPRVAQHEDIDASLSNALRMAAKASASNSARVAPTAQFFLKPWGTKENPIRILERRDFGDEQGNLDFPKGKPSDVRIEDVIITFGTGARSILSVHKALSWPEERSPEVQESNEHARRWPWFIFAQNLTPKFGSAWWEYDITIDELAERFLSENSESVLSGAGGKSLGAFQRGAGRLRLSDEFGRYVFDRIMDIENVRAG